MIEVRCVGLEHTSCKSKMRHRSLGKAQKEAARLNDVNGYTCSEIREAYECNFCEGWHVGRPSPVSALLARHATKGDVGAKAIMDEVAKLLKSM